MSSQTVIFTALPNGIVTSDGGSALRLSVHVGMRLQPDGGLNPLRDFPIVEWPSFDWAFPVRVDVPGSGFDALANRVSQMPDMELWRRIFTPELAVVGHERSDLPDRAIRTAPVVNLKRFVGETWATWGAATPETIPTKAELEGGLGGDLRLRRGRPTPDPVGRVPALPPGPLRSDLARQLEGQLAAQKAASLRDPNDSSYDPVHDVFEHQRFFDRRPAGNEGASFPPPQEPVLRFHQVLTLVGQHPELMRRLGLVIDLEVPVPAGASLPVNLAFGTVRILPEPRNELATTVTTVTPNTAIGLSSERFLARPRDPGYNDGGVIRFDNSEVFAPIDVDVDGAVFKLSNFQSSLDSLDFEVEPGGIPALRSFGLSIAQRGRAIAQRDRFANMAVLDDALLTPAPPTLFAEDITRGLRVHVWSDRWRSLLRRQGSYRIGPPGDQITFDTQDEGWVTTSPTEHPEDPKPVRDLYLQESMFTWTGWSLAAPRPGKLLNKAEQPERIEDNPVGKRTDAPAVSVSFRAQPGTLPRLRYGTEYRFRAFGVDLAGNSPGPGPDTELGSGAPPSDPVTYRRYEPVPPPVVLLRRPRTEGESVERLVIRSDFDTAASATGPTERHLAPPRMSQLMAEQHGLFDTPNGVSKSVYEDVDRRDRFTFESSPQGVLEPGGTASRYFDVPALDTGYLPDVLAAGVVFFGLPGTEPAEPFVVPFGAGSAWPVRSAVRLKVVEGTSPPTTIDEGGVAVVVVSMPKGRVVRVRYNSILPADPAVQDLLGLVHLMETHQPARALAFRQLVEQNRTWMVTPYRILTLVHAVRRPLRAPKFFRDGVQREPGGTSVTFAQRFELDGASTSKLEMVANWRDQVDPGVPLDLVPDGFDPAAYPDPGTRPSSVTAFGVELARPGENPDFITRAGLRHDIGDTRAHLITYAPRATTSFAEYFIERRVEQFVPVAGSNPPAYLPLVLSAAGVAPGSVEVKSLDRTVTFTVGVDYTVDEQAGTIAGLAGGSIPADPVEVSFVAAPISRDGEGFTSVVPSTAKPAAPGIRYVLPTFRWTKGGDGVRTRTSTRQGNSLRVYLDRPWWSSGDGELLGVVLLGGASVTTSNADLLKRAAPYVTQFGNDPISTDGPTPGRLPVLADFTSSAAVDRGTGLSVEGLAEPVDVAGHGVTFDPDRKLWSTDITLDNLGPAYFPFVRLALARYQPRSLAGCELSPVVLADFMQVAPDRQVQVTYDPSSPRTIDVGVIGRSHLNEGPPPFRLPVPNRIRVTVETQDIPKAGDLGWAPPKGSTSVELNSSTPTTGIFPGLTRWSRRITLPADRWFIPQRLVIEEFEERPSDGRSDNDGRRIVFTDIVRL